MVVLPSILAWLALSTAVEPSSAERSGYRPTGSLEEIADLGLLARLRDPRVRPIAIGPEGMKRVPGPIPARTDPERAATITRLVLAEIAGPGIVQRISLIEPTALPRGFDRSGIRLRVNLDGLEESVLLIPLDELAAGRHPHFPRPLAGRVAGETFSYVPIAFRSGCRILLDGPHAALYRAQVRGVALPDGADIAPFWEPPSGAEQAKLARAAAIWSAPADPLAVLGEPMETSDYAVDGAAHSTQRFLLPAGPRTIRSLEIEPAPGSADAWRDARLKLLWESDDCSAGVDLPLGFAFARITGAEPGSSLLMGSTGPAWYNRFPMPYRRQGFLQLESKEPIRGTIRVRSLGGIAADAGYLRASYRDGLLETSHRASKPFAGFGPVELDGRGHYAGALLAVVEPRAAANRLADLPKPAEAVRLVIPGLGEVLSIRGLSAQAVAWDASPAFGLFLSPADATTRQSVGFRWHPADPIPFVRPIAATIAPASGDLAALATDSRVAVAVYWYSERPGPSGDRP